ncbi:MAG: thioredoxin domain-containing protein [Flavobacteriaceae bacterium]
MNSNTLQLETSPYLLQHAQNPIHWQRWEEKLYKKQNNEQKLIVVSIGYSSCHWCHVMEKETFEDSNVAQFMNKYFVSIKVDREENPEIDTLYMTATQMMTGSGGWPLNVVCLPDGRPVYGGTYHTKEQWLDVLGKIQRLYENDKSQLEEFADRVEKGIQEVNRFGFTAEKKGDTLILESEMKYWSRQWDNINGGEERQQKFITPVKFQYIQQFQQLTQDKEIQNYFDNSLVTIANSGIFDHIEGGFYRYTVDPEWNIPHFEKMLYDNAQLVGLFANAYKQNKNPLFKQRVYQTFSFLKNRMSHSEGGFYSAIDADNDQGEGRYSVFSQEELEQITGADFELFSDYHNLTVFEEKYFHLKQNPIDEAFLSRHQITWEALQTKKDLWHKGLKAQMASREFPLIDTKILTSWNALLVVGLTQAYEAFGDSLFLEEAKTTYEFLRKKSFKKGQLYHTYQEGMPKIKGFLEDYAFLIQAALTLYKNTFDLRFLDEASEWTEIVIQNFKDTESPYFMFTPSPTLFSKIIILDDNVIPSPNSVMAGNLWQLGKYLDKKEYLDLVDQMITGILSNFSEGRSSDYSQWCQLIANLYYPFCEVVIVGPNATNLKIELLKNYLPNMLLQGSTKPSDLSLLKDRYSKDKTSIYVCNNKVCLRPVETIWEALEQIESFE